MTRNLFLFPPNPRLAKAVGFQLEAEDREVDLRRKVAVARAAVPLRVVHELTRDDTLANVARPGSARVEAAALTGDQGPHAFEGVDHVFSDVACVERSHARDGSVHEDEARLLREAKPEVDVLRHAHRLP